MSQTECNTLLNEKRLIPTEELVFRPSVYGLVKNEGKILLIRTSATGVYEFPGGGIELGERMEEALRRELIEEAGIEVSVGKFLLFKENFFYHDRTQEAYHSLLFVYECSPLQKDLPEAHIDVDGRETEEPVWADISTLEENDFAGTDREFFTEFKGKGIF
jgi:nucleoside triphosphatase